MRSLRRALAVRFSLTMILALAFVLALVSVLIGQPRASQRRSGLSLTLTSVRSSHRGSVTPVTADFAIVEFLGRWDVLG